MILSQKWIGYLDRSYEQIKQSLLLRLGTTNPEITDHSENNPLIIILSMFAGIGEMLNLYIDNMARETFIGTARKFSSAVKLSYLMDYSVKAKNPASTNLAFILNVSADEDIIIPMGSQFSNGLGVIFTLPFAFSIPAGVTKVYEDVSQYIEIPSTLVGVSDGTPNQSFQLSDDYVHKSLRITINFEVWKEYNSFGLMKSDTKGYVISVGEDNHAYVRFGDGINGLIPFSENNIFETYQESLGSLGNLPPNSITIIESNIALPDGIILTVNNEQYAAGGEDFETLEDIKNRAPRSLRTLETAKTYQDYLDLPILVPGVKDAALRYCCGKFIDLYIAPKGRGNATQILLDAVKEYMEPRKMITTFINYYASGITKLWIKGKVYGKPLVKSIDIQLQVADAFDKKYGYEVAQINSRIIISEIIALIENLSLVDRFELEQIRILPFARPIEDTTTTLNISFSVLPVTIETTIYRIIWDGTKFDIFINGEFQASINPGESFADATVSFSLPSGSYNINDTWEFSTFPSYPEIFPSTVISINDLSEPVIDVAPFINNSTVRAIYGDIQIITTSVDPLQLPVC